MATTVRVSRWDDAAWDDEGNALNLVQVGGTFTVSNIDQNNRVVTFTPQNLIADSWDDATFWSDGTLASHFTLSQSFTVTAVDINNRVVTLSG
jgi:hypothetical protein